MAKSTDNLLVNAVNNFLSQKGATSCPHTVRAVGATAPSAPVAPAPLVLLLVNNYSTIPTIYLICTSFYYTSYL